MKTYNLFLDESGQFIENKNGTGRPAIVAGYIVENLNSNADTWAQGLLEQTKNSNAFFNKINIERFHALEDTSPAMSECNVSLMKKVVKQNIRLVSFQNVHGMYIVDSDKTYLNVFAEGLVKLIRHLLAETDDFIQLHVTYAHRIYVVKKDISSAPIPPTEYTERIRERVSLRLGRLPQEEKNRLKFDFEKKDDFDGNEAKYYAPLKIADAVCAAFRGKRDSLTPEQIRRITTLKCLEFSVLENETWNLIQDFIAEDRLADAIYTWCIHLTEKELLHNEYHFYDLLTQKIHSMNSTGVSAQFQVLSKLIGSFVDRREFAIANKVMEPILNTVYPRLEKSGINIARPCFDIWFYRLTTATHEGDTPTEVTAIKECDDLQKKINWTYEDLNYLILYKLRKVEHLKNNFEFKGAETVLKELIATMKQAKSCLELIDEYRKDEYKNIKSVTLGKLYGSLVGTQVYMIQEKNNLIDETRINSNKAIENFTDEIDIQRQYQMRAQAEYSIGNYTEALNWLKKSAGIPVDASTGNLVTTFVEHWNVFGLMHYAKIMEAASLNGHELGKELYNQWNRQNVNVCILDQLKANHPAYVMFGSLAITRAILAVSNNEAIEKSFNKAIEKAEASKSNFTCYAAGLSYEAKKLALFVENAEERKIARTTLHEHLNQFLNMRGMPDSIKQVFTGWKELFRNEDIDTDAKGYKNIILQKALQVPIL